MACGSELGARCCIGGMRMEWVACGWHGRRMGAEGPWGLMGPDTKRRPDIESAEASQKQRPGLRHRGPPGPTETATENAGARQAPGYDTERRPRQKKRWERTTGPRRKAPAPDTKTAAPRHKQGAPGLEGPDTKSAGLRHSAPGLVRKSAGLP